MRAARGYITAGGLGNWPNYYSAVEGERMGGEIFSTAVIIFTLTLVGLGIGFLMLRVQGGEE
jgi:cytochrome b6-f complex subunit 7